MKNNLLKFSGAVMLPLLFASAAAAQATRTWVSGVGDDANPCSRTAPCRTFPGAISKTAAGGEIDTLDPGGFGAVTITKSITLASEGTGEGGILVAGTNGITINAGANDTIVLRGLEIDGGPLGSNSLAGVKFNAGGTLIVQNSVIRNFTNPNANYGYGIAFTPSAASSMFVSDTLISNNGGGTFGGGILVQPTGAGSAKVSIVRVNAVNNVLGIHANGTGTTAGIYMSISDTKTASNAFSGISAFTTREGAPVFVAVTNSTSSNNGTGVNAHGTGVTMRLGNSSITGNRTSVAIVDGATMTSLGNNMIVDNVVMGPFVPIVAAQ